MIRNQVSVSESETRGQFGCLYICCCMRSCFNAFHRLGPSSASITVFLCFLGLAWGWWRTDFDFVGGELAAPTSTAERQAPTISNPSSQLYKKKSQQPTGSSEAWAQLMGRGPENAPALEWRGAQDESWPRYLHPTARETLTPDGK